MRTCWGGSGSDSGWKYLTDPAWLSVTTKIIIIIIKNRKRKSCYQWANKMSVDEADKSVPSTDIQ